jgi:UTP--glucose-1-phosphate uridylyltransferase
MADRDIRKAVIPAAGFGTRFLPAAKSIPKEMLAVVDKPMIQYAVEEAAASGIRRIGIVANRRKRVVQDHFGPGRELVSFLEAKGRGDLIAELAEIRRLARIAYIFQPSPRGLGHAVLMGESFVGGEPFAVLNPDTIYDGPRPCLRRLLDVFAEKRRSVVVLGRIGNEGKDKYGVVRATFLTKRVYKIQDLAEKPGRGSAFSNLAVLGRYVFTPRIFDSIRTAAPGKGGEIQITDAIRDLLGREPVYGVLYEGKHFDAGDKFGFLEATLHFGLKRPEFRERLRKTLKALLGEAGGD